MAILMAFLNQLFAFSFDRPPWKSSVGPPSERRMIAGAKLPLGVCIKPLRESFELSSKHAAPSDVRPLAVTSCQTNSDASFGSSYSQLQPLENSRAATLISASGLEAEISSSIGSTFSTASLTAPILLPIILPDVSITKNSVIVLRGTLTTSSKSPIIVKFKCL